MHTGAVESWIGSRKKCPFRKINRENCNNFASDKNTTVLVAGSKLYRILISNITLAQSKLF